MLIRNKHPEREFPLQINTLERERERERERRKGERVASSESSESSELSESSESSKSSDSRASTFEDKTCPNNSVSIISTLSTDLNLNYTSESGASAHCCGNWVRLARASH